MKKSLVALTYFSFPGRGSEQIIEDCYSTLGFLSKLSNTWNVFFAVRAESDFEPIHHQGIHVFFIQGTSLKKEQIPWRLNRFVSTLSPDYILVHGFGSAPYLVFLKLLCPKAKIMLQCNGFASAPGGFKKWVYKFSDKFIDGYLFTGIHNAATWYKKKIFKQSKVFELMEGSTSFRFDTQATRREKSYLWVANLIPLKDPLTVLQAFDGFLELEPEAHLTLIYHETELLEIIQQYVKNSERLQKAVHLKGFVPHQELESVFNEHQFFITGSHREGSGYALLEAMACGCVPIVTDIPSHRFMTDDGNCALLFSVGNEMELLEKLRQSQSINYQQWQYRVLRHFKNHLSFRGIATRLGQIFQSL